MSLWFVIEFILVLFFLILDLSFLNIWVDKQQIKKGENMF